MKINYTEKGQPISDFELENFFRDNINNEDMIDVSTDNVVDLGRLFVVRGEISNLSFYFNGNLVGVVNEYGVVLKDGKQNWPQGFHDRMINYSREILQRVLKKRKQKNGKAQKEEE